MTGVRKNRNAAVELYRLLMMYGICLLHAAIGPAAHVTWLLNCTMFCVTAFAFVSGYYGIRFAPSKVLRLWGLGLVCALICGRGDFVLSWRLFGEYWFLHAYVLLMTFAPLVNRAFAATSDGNLPMVAPLLLAIFAWGFAPSLPVLRDMGLPVTPGLEAYSGLTLLGAYAGARLYRTWRLNERLNGRWAACALAVLMVLAGSGICEYNLIVALLLSAVTFRIVSGIVLPRPAERVILLAAPSVFAVYLLHQPNIDILWSCVTALLDRGCGLYLAYVLTALATLTVALLADVPRRLVAAILCPWIVRFWSQVDDFYERALKSVERKMLGK